MDVLHHVLRKLIVPALSFFFFSVGIHPQIQISPPQPRFVYSGIVRTKEAWRQRAYAIITQTTSLFDPAPPPPVRTQFGVIGRRARSRCLFGGWRWTRGQRLFTLYKCINTEDTLFIEKIIKIASIIWDGHTRSLFFPVPRLCKRKLGAETSRWFMEINDETNPPNVQCFYVLTVYIYFIDFIGSGLHTLIDTLAIRHN